MNPNAWYLKKKVWVAIVSAVGAMIAAKTDNQDMADKIVYVGMTLIGALGLEDFGKAKDQTTPTETKTV
jgi:hypothetical protein